MAILPPPPISLCARRSVSGLFLPAKLGGKLEKIEPRHFGEPKGHEDHRRIEDDVGTQESQVAPSVGVAHVDGREVLISHAVPAVLEAVVALGL